MEELKCKNCGSDLIEKNGQYICQYCGAKYIKKEPSTTQTIVYNINNYIFADSAQTQQHLPAEETVIGGEEASEEILEAVIEEDEQCICPYCGSTECLSFGDSLRLCLTCKGKYLASGHKESNEEYKATHDQTRSKVVDDQKLSSQVADSKKKTKTRSKKPHKSINKKALIIAISGVMIAIIMAVLVPYLVEPNLYTNDLLPKSPR